MLILRVIPGIGSSRCFAVATICPADCHSRFIFRTPAQVLACHKSIDPWCSFQGNRLKPDSSGTFIAEIPLLFGSAGLVNEISYMT
jgi:hypothetical protein